MTWAFCFFEIHKRSYHHRPSKDIIETSYYNWHKERYKKEILILQGVNLCFQNTRQSNDCIFWMTCVGSLTKKLDFWKIFSKTDISLISFQQLNLNRHDLWDMRFDSRIRKIIKQEEHWLSLQIFRWKWHQHFSTLLKKWSSQMQYIEPWKRKSD